MQSCFARPAVLLLVVLTAAPLLAGDHTGGFTIEPSSGPLRGGTVVKITGHFGTWPYGVSFGELGSVAGYRVNDTTLYAITPPGFGTVPVYVIEGDIGIAELEFTYEARNEDYAERVLLPLLTPPVSGAHGAEFRTEFRAYNNLAHEPVLVEGLDGGCVILCISPLLEIEPLGEVQPEDIAYDGRPGRFAFLPRSLAGHVWMQLRVFDTSRSDDQYGTTIPVVRDKDMFVDRAIAFAGIPTGPRFRNTLRIYAAGPAVVNVEIAHGASTITRQVALQDTRDAYVPAYAMIGDLPSDVGPLRITIRPPAAGQAGFGTPMWAFVSVTNNETQLITVVMP